MVHRLTTSNAQLEEQVRSLTSQMMMASESITKVTAIKDNLEENILQTTTALDTTQDALQKLETVSFTFMLLPVWMCTSHFLLL